MDVFVDGRAIRKDGRTLTLNEEKVAQELEDASQEYYSEI